MKTLNARKPSITFNINIIEKIRLRGGGGGGGGGEMGGLGGEMGWGCGGGGGCGGVGFGGGEGGGGWVYLILSTTSTPQFSLISSPILMM